MNLCVSCNNAKMQRDICGIYCKLGYQSPCTDCQHYAQYKKRQVKKAVERKEADTCK